MYFPAKRMQKRHMSEAQKCRKKCVRQGSRINGAFCAVPNLHHIWEYSGSAGDSRTIHHRLDQQSALLGVAAVVAVFAAAFVNLLRGTFPADNTCMQSGEGAQTATKHAAARIESQALSSTRTWPGPSTPGSICASN